MIALGIVRRVDHLGRVVLPSKLRLLYHIKDNDIVEMYREGESIIIKKYLPKCIFCGGTLNVESFKGKCICKACMGILRGSN